MANLYEYKYALYSNEPITKQVIDAIVDEVKDEKPFTDDMKCKIHNIPVEVEVDQIDVNLLEYYPFCPLCYMVDTIELHSKKIHEELEFFHADDDSIKEIKQHVRIIEMYKDTILKQWKYKQK